MVQGLRKVSVRRAGPDDAAATAALLAAAFAPLRAQYTPAAYEATTPDAGEVRRRLAEGPTWLAVDAAGVALGTLSAVRKGDALHLRSMAVLPAARGAGIGRRLLGEAEAFARAGAQHRLTLSTTPFLDAAIRLYEAAGFRRTSAGPHDLAGTPLFTMERRLDAPTLPLPR